MLISEYSRQFRTDGYLVLEHFFDDTLMDRLDRLIRAHFGDNPAFGHQAEFLDRSQTEVIPWFPPMAAQSPSPWIRMTSRSGLASFRPVA